ncbi:MAG: VOC family protein [Verrucomicrobiales bacterium]
MLMRFDESPEPTPPGMVPEGWEKKVMHASLLIGKSRVMLSDGCESGGEGFNGFSLSLTVADEAEASRVFGVLSDGGTVQMPIGKTFWSPCFGIVEDRFGVSG